MLQQQLELYVKDSFKDSNDGLLTNFSDSDLSLYRELESLNSEILEKSKSYFQSMTNDEPAYKSLFQGYNDQSVFKNEKSCKPVQNTYKKCCLNDLEDG